MSQSTVAWTKISAMDLAEVKKKYLSRKPWYKRWFHNANKVEAEYRRFLHLIACNPDQAIVPWTQDIDDMWHEHILDTGKYEKDCQNIFGKFIHHNPHLPKGTLAHRNASIVTSQLRRTTQMPATTLLAHLKAKDAKRQKSVLSKPTKKNKSAGCTPYASPTPIEHVSCSVMPVILSDVPSHDPGPSYSSPSPSYESSSHDSGSSSHSSSCSSSSCSSGSSCSSSSCSSGSSCGSSCSS